MLKKEYFFGSESFMSEQEKRKHRVCFTGHRPEKLSMSEGKVKSALLQEIMKSINDGYNVFISGMARGVDMWAAEIVLELKDEFPDIKLIAAIPFEGFEQSWSKENKQAYNHILEQADLIKFICPKFSYSSYQIRNEWMVDHSAKVIAVWNGEKSGTKNTVDYANKCGVELVNIYKHEG